MNCQQMAEWEKKVSRGKQIQATLQAIDLHLAELAAEDRKIKVHSYGPNRSKLFLGTLTGEDVRDEVRTALSRILKDRRIALEKEFKEL